MEVRSSSWLLLSDQEALYYIVLPSPHRGLAGSWVRHPKHPNHVRLSHTGELDTWVNIDSDEGESCATSDWDSPSSSPPDSPRALTPDQASTGGWRTIAGNTLVCDAVLNVHLLRNSLESNIRILNGDPCATAADARSSEVPIAANGKKASGRAAKADGKLAPSTPEAPSQGLPCQHIL